MKPLAPLPLTHTYRGKPCRIVMTRDSYNVNTGERKQMCLIEFEKLPAIEVPRSEVRNA